MNRKILFTAKTINSGEWVESMTIANGTIKRKAHDLFMEISENKWVGIIPDTLSQYIGIKNVFENSIVECKLTDGEILRGVIEYDKECCAFKLKVKIKKIHNEVLIAPEDCEFYMGTLIWAKAEINHIGNIFDNAEMLVSFCSER